MKIKYDKYFKTTEFTQYEPNQKFMPTDEEWEDDNLDVDEKLEIDIPYQEIKLFSEIWYEDLNYTCYGSEMCLLYTIKQFFDTMTYDISSMNTKIYSYNYTKVSEVFKSEAMAWLLITKFMNIDFIEYGTSPRFAWWNYTNIKAIKFMEMFQKYSLSALYEIINLGFNYVKDKYPEHEMYDQDGNVYMVKTNGL